MCLLRVVVRACCGMGCAFGLSWLVEIMVLDKMERVSSGVVAIIIAGFGHCLSQLRSRPYLELDQQDRVYE